MPAFLIKYGVLIFSAIALAILIITYIANGSESEDAWLYIICIWLVLYTAYDAYSKSKDK